MDLTSPVAANQLAAGTFFQVKMATQDLAGPVAAAVQLATGHVGGWFQTCLRSGGGGGYHGDRAQTP